MTIKTYFNVYIYLSNKMQLLFTSVYSKVMLLYKKCIIKQLSNIQFIRYEKWYIKHGLIIIIIQWILNKQDIATKCLYFLYSPTLSHVSTIWGSAGICLLTMTFVLLATMFPFIKLVEHIPSAENTCAVRTCMITGSATRVSRCLSSVTVLEHFLLQGAHEKDWHDFFSDTFPRNVCYRLCTNTGALSYAQFCGAFSSH